VEVDDTVRGTVYIEGSVPPKPLQGSWIEFYSGARCWQGSFVTSVQTDEQGRFMVEDLPDGDIYIKACPQCGNLNYTNEWWDGGQGVIDCNQATAVTIGPGQTPPDVEFYVAPGATIRGRVTDSSAVGISNLWVEAFLGAPCWNGPFVASVQTDTEGDYELVGMPAGDIYVRTCAGCSGSFYVDKWWNNTGGSADCNEADPTIVATGGSIIPDKNFDLVLGGAISGTVHNHSGGVITDANLSVHAFPIDGSWSGIGTNVSQTDGHFTILGLPVGTYKVLVNNNRESAYETKYYPSSISWHEAESVNVTQNFTTQLPMDVMLGPPVQAFTIWTQKRARIFTYENDFKQSTQTVHVAKDIAIERWNGSQAIMTAPNMRWQPGEAVENPYVDIENSYTIPNTAIDPNTSDPTYEWIDFPDYTTDKDWCEFAAHESATTDILIPADIKRTVDKEEIPAEGGPQVVTLEVRVHDANIRRFIVRVYFDDNEIVNADRQGGNGTTNNLASTTRYRNNSTLSIRP
jgi:hypothetical protein